jgi:hypothetical protein
LTLMMMQQTSYVTDDTTNLLRLDNLARLQGLYQYLAVVRHCG